MTQNDPVVVTGMGAVSPLGVGVETNWQRLLEGKSGVVRNDRFDVSAYACTIAGLVPPRDRDPHGFDPRDHIDAKDIKKMDRFIQYGLAAADEALKQARWTPQGEAERARTATVIGSGVGGSPLMAEAVETILTRGPRRLSPFTVPAFLANLAAGWVSIRYGFTGPIGAPVTACAAAGQAIGDGLRLIMTGEADVVVCGGAEGSIDPISVGGFSAARALCTSYNETPEKASRPFDRDRAGFVLAEGSAMLVIERLSHARARGAIPLAILAGYGTTADAYHLTAGHPEGRSAAVSMRHALSMAGLAPADIDHINAHSTSTPVGDAAEIAAIKSLFADRGRDIAIASTKSATGHLLGAAGAIEAIFSVLSLRDGVVPATLNLENPDEAAARFDLVAGAPRRRKLRHVLSNAFGFGGVNAALVFSAAP
ncbi:beta-ketoacyl-ACP synthase II [Nitratireductor rhodophyticola]